MEYEKQEISKQRKKIKLELTYEINSIKDGQQFMKYEFKRINSLIQKILRTVRYQIEDLMLNQMLTEQESIDRKQLNLFGIKKNQQILGKNQYALTNNIHPDNKFFEARNKVCSTNRQTSPNIRGLDFS